MSKSESAPILARVVCRIHGANMGVVLMNQRGFPDYESTNPALYARHLRALGTRNTTRWHLRDEYGDNVSGEVDAWCRDCGYEARQVPKSDLLAAADGLRSKVIPV
jgi:hypothetical protein